MTVTALATTPTPPNGNTDRAMFVWGDDPGSQYDPLTSDATQNALLAFCGANGVNVVFLDIWNYLGAGNWSAANRNATKKFVSAANQSGIRVHALMGNKDWGHNQQWVGKNILRRIAEFNVEARSISGANYEGARFDGVMFDVEYYTVEGYDAQVEVSGLCDLMRAARQILGVTVGCFTTQWIINAQDVTYGGATKKEGMHLMDAADHVAVGCYDCNDGVAAGATQIGMFAAWHAYALANPGSAGLWCGSEVGLATPEGYAGKTKTTMELSHAAISAAYAVPASLAFRGQAIDAYHEYALMAP